MEIRRAVHDDIPAIVSFTTGTFEWGDYVPDVIEEWIDDPEGVTMVALDDGVPVAVARTLLLTPTEGWAHGIRVHPDHRGSGVAAALAGPLLEWVRDAGALVVRLLVEDDNTPSIRHVEKLGFRRTTRLIRASRAVGEATANPDGNGVRRGPSSLEAKPGKTQDAPMVLGSWTSSEIGRAMRGLIGEGWRFHTMRVPDVETAARLGALWEIGSSWAITSTTDPWFQVAMLDTRPDDAYETIGALIDAANNRGAEQVSIWLPPLDWVVQAARRTGCDVSPSSIWEYTL
jgi:ribosomal protein S18 acetylase RimI-like enzyme